MTPHDLVVPKAIGSDVEDVNDDTKALPDSTSRNIKRKEKIARCIRA